MSSHEIGTVDDACEIIGGTKPISKPTFYRGVKAGRFPPPFHPSPGISRVDLRLLRERVRQTAGPAASSTDDVTG